MHVPVCVCTGVCACFHYPSIDAFHVFVSHHFALELDPVYACEHACFSLRGHKWGSWLSVMPEDQAQP